MRNQGEQPIKDVKDFFREQGRNDLAGEVERAEKGERLSGERKERFDLPHVDAGEVNVDSTTEYKVRGFYETNGDIKEWKYYPSVQQMPKNVRKRLESEVGRKVTRKARANQDTHPGASHD